MQIIQLKTQDRIDDITGIFNQYMIFYNLPSDEGSYKIFLQARLENQEAVIFMAISDQGNPMGFVLNYPSFSTLSQGKIIVLNDLFVLAEHRKKGVAKALIAATFEFAAQGNFLRVDLSTANDNFEAQRLYNKLGFEKVLQFDYYSYILNKK